MEGKAELEREFKRNSIEMTDAELTAFLEKIGTKHSCNTIDDVYSAIGYGGIQLLSLIHI